MKIFCQTKKKLSVKSGNLSKKNYFFQSSTLDNKHQATTMSLYCWGNTAHGELGLGGIEDEQVDYNNRNFEL